MMRRQLLILTLLIVSFTAFSQKDPWPNSLLWRVSGNGLSKPSYLYGTMHVQDKRVFKFTDSVYRAIESVDGLALEVNFNEMVDSLLNKMMDEREEKEEEDEEIKDWNVDSVMKTLKISKRTYSPGTLKKIREARIRKLGYEGEMPTIVDGYLFGLALRHGKWTGGIEDVSDQLNLVDEFGGELTPEKAFEPESQLRSSLDEMIRIYIKNDLEAINNYIETRMDRSSKNSLLVTRNVKMARRMDSLSKWRTMFFAVGAAHLPGDSGVINLLRRAGFQVEPVFSPTSTTAESYSKKLNAVSWKEVSDDAFYSIKMPGSPSDFNRFGEAVQMKVFFDLPTMTYYMSGHTIRNNQTFSELSNTFRDLMKNMGAKNGKPKLKDVSANGIIGVEGTFDIPAGSYKVRLLQKKKILYMLMAGSTKRSNLNDEDLNKFFTSFVPKAGPAVDNRFKTFTIAGKNFSVDLPGTPKPNKDVDKASESSSWIFSTYDLADREKGLYFMVQVRDMKPGFYLEGDTSYFDVFSAELSNSFRIVKKEYSTFQNWNAMDMLFADDEGLNYRMYSVVRGNRIYTLFGGGLKGNAPEIDTVFGSFRFIEPAATSWSRHSIHGFSSIAPAPFVLQEKEEDDDDNMQHFVSYDSTSAISYEVLVTKLPEHYWSKSDSAFFANRKERNTNYTDTVLSYQPVSAGKLKGVEYIIRKQGSNTVKRLREYVTGDTIYTAIAFLPEASLSDPLVNSYFTGFSINSSKQPTIYTSKARELLLALQTKDSAEFAKHSEVLDAVTFTREDLPYLHEALMYDYAFDHSYNSVQNYLTNALEGLADETTIEFIRSNYEKLNGRSEVLKYDLLTVLAEMKTKKSYDLLKELVLKHPPVEGRDISLAYALQDSIQLTRSLYPDLLSLTVHHGFADINAILTPVLIDSGLLNKEAIIPYHDIIITQAGKKLDSLQMDTEYWYQYSDWPIFVGLVNNEKVSELLNEYIRVDNKDIQLEAAVALAKNDQTVPSKISESLASDKEYRIHYYRRLKAVGRTSLFPAKYATQQKIAESEIYQIASEDEDYPNSVTFLSEKTAEYKGKMAKFYLFRVGYGEGKDETFYLGVTGPYPIDGKTIIDETDAGGLNYDEEYEKSKADDLFRTYLKILEEYSSK